MVSDKEIKKEFKAKAGREPERYYATKVLKRCGFERRQCTCGIWFWTVNKGQKVCGDSACSGGFRFFDHNPCKEPLSYAGVWQKFSKMFRSLGYTPIKRYPVVARWRDDMDFVIASIADFQPYVVSGEVAPPASPLVVPQFCLRFGDIDNVGITGSHLTCFNMIGQHMFVSPEKWDQEKVFSDIKKWINDGLGIPDSEVTFHEDVWAGGGNFGPCMEFFSRGVELGNQVYMMFEQTDKGPRELKLKVLDMGMGMERCAWFSQGTPTIYDAVFPSVMEKLMHATGIRPDKALLKRYVPFAGLLNLDEVEDIDRSWQDVAEKAGVGVEKLKKEVMPMAAMYSVAEHARGLLIALTDGALPSNVGGGYNLRILARRSFSFIDQYRWDIRLPDVCRWHAEELKPLFPELSGSLDEVQKILEVEKSKYEATKQKTASIVEKTVAKGKFDDKLLLELYDSQGIPPEIIREEAEKLGKAVEVPEDFYMKVSALHEQREQEHATKKEEKLPLAGVQGTKALYFDDYSSLEFKGKVLKILGKDVVLDQTAAYPTSGGQLHDIGTLDGERYADVFKQGAVIVHVMETPPSFKEGSAVAGKIDAERRKQLAQHHTSTHIVNAAARRVLGRHINQAGAKKTEEKAHLDVTHYQGITNEELKRIEEEANKIVRENLPIRKVFMLREQAEKEYGMAIYQGGAVPGKMIRVVDIPEVDVEACGGTHLNSTGEAGRIKIVKSAKIQDGIVRITFVAGKAAQAGEKEEKGILGEAARLLDCKKEQVPARTEELFSLWKSIVKKKKDVEFRLTATDIYSGDILAKTADVLKTQPEHILRTLQRFLDEIKEKKK